MINYFNLRKFANKQPWQMTKAEFLQNERDVRGIANSAQTFTDIFKEKTSEPNWKPLYNFLARIGDKEHRFADGFMYFGAYPYLAIANRDAFKILQKYDEFVIPKSPMIINAKSILLYDFKHIITRKIVKVDENGLIYKRLVSGPSHNYSRIDLQKDKKLKYIVKFDGVTDQQVQEAVDIVYDSNYDGGEDAKYQEYWARELEEYVFKELDEGRIPGATRETSSGEFNRNIRPKLEEELIRQGYKVLRVSPTGVDVQNPATTHSREVEKALAQGLPVPDDVLLDYPDLKQKYRP